MLLRSNAPQRSADGSALVYSVLIDLYEWTSSGELRTKKHVYEQMAPAFTFIAQNYASPITLEQLAKELSVSEQHTCLLFRQTTDCAHSNTSPASACAKRKSAYTTADPSGQKRGRKGRI